MSTFFNILSTTKQIYKLSKKKIQIQQWSWSLNGLGKRIIWREKNYSNFYITSFLSHIAVTENLWLDLWKGPHIQ